VGLERGQPDRFWWTVCLPDPCTHSTLTSFPIRHSISHSVELKFRVTVWSRVGASYKMSRGGFSWLKSVN
jgi:hypothetical protein